MKTLPSTRIVHSRNNGIDTVHIYFQEQNEPVVAHSVTDGYILYNEDFQWIGIEFSYDGNNFNALFDLSCTPSHKEANEFELSANKDGIFSIKCINGIINGIGNPHPFHNIHT